jgi:hypothetical protein
MSIKHSESVKELAAALAKAQGSMTAAKMDAVNPFLKNKYADLGSIIQAARKPLSDNGLAFTQHPTMSEAAVTVTTFLAHASGEWIESEITLPLDGSKGMSLAQSMGSIITYLRRYTLAAILGIYADEDTDGNESKSAKKEQPKPEEQPAQPQPSDAKPWTSEFIPLKMAQAEVSSDGTHYMDLPTEKLSYMANNIVKTLGKPDLDENKKAELSRKRQVIQEIIAWRNS